MIDSFLGIFLKEQGKSFNIQEENGRILDVFAEQKYAGNQLAVFLGNPSDEVMQQLALEMNYSETTFITSDTPENGGYNVRIFMPNMEIPFAGHPTLGTATIIRNELMQQPGDMVLLNLQVGQIPVTFQDNGVAWMQQNPPVFGRSYEAEAVADVLNLTTADIDTRFPIQDVSTGLPFTIVPLKTLDAVKRARMDVPKLRQLLQIQSKHIRGSFGLGARSARIVGGAA